MTNPDHIQHDTVSQEVLAARTGQSDILGKLDDELPSLRINGDAVIELERRWRASGLGSLSEYRRMVLYVNLFGEEHVANLYAAKVRRVVGNAGTLPGKVEAELS